LKSVLHFQTNLKQTKLDISHQHLILQSFFNKLFSLITSKTTLFLLTVKQRALILLRIFFYR